MFHHRVTENAEKRRKGVKERPCVGIFVLHRPRSIRRLCALCASVVKFVTFIASRSPWFVRMFHHRVTENAEKRRKGVKERPCVGIFVLHRPRSIRRLCALCASVVKFVTFIAPVRSNVSPQSHRERREKARRIGPPRCWKFLPSSFRASSSSPLCPLCLGGEIYHLHPIAIAVVRSNVSPQSHRERREKARRIGPPLCWKFVLLLCALCDSVVKFVTFILSRSPWFVRMFHHRVTENAEKRREGSVRLCAGSLSFCSVPSVTRW